MGDYAWPSCGHDSQDVCRTQELTLLLTVGSSLLLSSCLRATLAAEQALQ